MALTLTNLIPDAYEALDVISRESTGFIPAVNRNSNVERAAIGQSVRVPVTDEGSTADNTPAVTAPDTGDEVIDNVDVQITKSKHKPIRMNGEQTMGLQNAGTFSSIMADRFYQAMRTLVNEIETDVWREAYRSASRAYGVAGTTPFATANDMADFAGAMQILEENGAPSNDLQIVLGHTAMANLRGKQSGLFNVEKAGREDMLRNGMTDRVMNMAMRHSNSVGLHTKGTGTSYLIDGTLAEGDTTITVDGGAGTIIAGDVVTIAGDSSKYVVTEALDSGSFKISKPGLRVAPADNATVTVGDSYVANVAMARSSIVLATRAPAMPEGGDAANDVQTVVDPLTGMAFEIASYKQFHQNAIHVRLAWGTKSIAGRHSSLLLG